MNSNVFKAVVAERQSVVNLIKVSIVIYNGA